MVFQAKLLIEQTRGPQGKSRETLRGSSGGTQDTRRGRAKNKANSQAKYGFGTNRKHGKVKQNNPARQAGKEGSKHSSSPASDEKLKRFKERPGKHSVH